MWRLRRGQPGSALHSTSHQVLAVATTAIAMLRADAGEFAPLICVPGAEGATLAAGASCLSNLGAVSCGGKAAKLMAI